MFPLGVKISAKHCNVEGGGKMTNTEFLHHSAALEFLTQTPLSLELELVFSIHYGKFSVIHLPFQIKSTLCSVGSFLCNEMCRIEGSSLFCCPPVILLNSFGVTISV